jgi:hypothetical protein
VRPTSTTQEEHHAQANREAVACGLVSVQMVHVRYMRMTVPHPRVPVRVGMGLARWVVGQVLVLMVGVVHVRVVVLQGLVLMFVLMVFSHV